MEAATGGRKGCRSRWGFLGYVLGLLLRGEQLDVVLYLSYHAVVEGED
jgi:hypothetical protein